MLVSGHAIAGKSKFKMAARNQRQRCLVASFVMTEEFEILENDEIPFFEHSDESVFILLKTVYTVVLT